MGDFDNLAAYARDRRWTDTRLAATSSPATEAWIKYAQTIGISVHSADERDAFVTGFDLGRDTATETDES